MLLVVLGLTATGVIDFQSKFNALAGTGAYAKVLATASGTNLAPGFSLAHTLTFLVWPAFSILFAINSVSFSGEIKNVRRGQLYGITGAMLLSGLIDDGNDVLPEGRCGEQVPARVLRHRQQVPLPPSRRGSTCWLP